jgi:hypothetical protein
VMGLMAASAGVAAIVSSCTTSNNENHTVYYTDPQTGVRTKAACNPSCTYCWPATANTGRIQDALPSSHVVYAACRGEELPPPGQETESKGDIIRFRGFSGPGTYGFDDWGQYRYWDWSGHPDYTSHVSVKAGDHTTIGLEILDGWDTKYDGWKANIEDGTLLSFGSDPAWPVTEKTFAGAQVNLTVYAKAAREGYTRITVSYEKATGGWEQIVCSDLAKCEEELYVRVYEERVVNPSTDPYNLYRVGNPLPTFDPSPEQWMVGFNGILKQAVLSMAEFLVKYERPSNAWDNNGNGALDLIEAWDPSKPMPEDEVHLLIDECGEESSRCRVNSGSATMVVNAPFWEHWQLERPCAAGAQTVYLWHNAGIREDEIVTIGPNLGGTGSRTKMAREAVRCTPTRPWRHLRGRRPSWASLSTAAA